MKIKTTKYVVPAWSIPVLVNGDNTATTEQEDEQLEKFCNRVISEGYSACPLDYTFIGFTLDNDVTKLGGNCYTVTFQKL